MPTPRSVKLIAVILTVASFFLMGAPLGVAALAPGTDEVEALRKQATKARTELDQLDKDWKAQDAKLTEAKDKLRATLEQLGAADAEFEKIREPLAALANNAYQAPSASGSMSIFGGGSPDQALRAAADVSFLANSNESLLKTASELRTRREKLADEAQDLQSRMSLDSAKIEKQKKATFARINALTTQLNQMLKRLDLDRTTKLTLQCDPALAADSGKFPNGLIPSKYLCKLPQKDSLLRADAALAFLKLNVAYKKRFGKDMCVRDAYRNLAEQQRLYYTRPGYAAIPGRSNHGFGTALDLCDGVQSQGSPQFNWLRANSTQYGWFHPSWAYSSPFEPWHWEFGKEGQEN